MRVLGIAVVLVLLLSRSMILRLLIMSLFFMRWISPVILLIILILLV